MKKLLLVVVMLFALNMNQVDAATTVTGIDDGYEGTDVTIEADEQYRLYIDGVLYESGIEYSVIGHHVLQVEEDGVIVEELTFTIVPNLGRDITRDEQTEFFNTLEIDILNEGSYSIMVNGKRVTGKQEYTEVGYYNVLVFGVNGYSKGYEFTLHDPRIEFLTTTILNDEYKITGDIYQSVFINDELHTGEILLDKYGYYKVDLIGVNGYSNHLYFVYTIDESDYSDRTVKKFKLDIEYADSVILNGEIQTKDMTLDEVGYHHIIVTGVNGFVEEFDITILEKTIEIEDYEVREKFVVGDVGGTLYLNDEPYKPNTEVTAIGDYTFKVVGVNGYESVVHFQIRKDYPIENYKNYYEPVVLNIDIDKIYVNGKLENSGFRIGKTGTYEIVIKGAGDFTETFTITYRNYNDQFIPVLNILAFSFAGIVFTIYGIIFWRRSK